jgi:hypothetical protein
MATAPRPTPAPLARRLDLESPDLVMLGAIAAMLLLVTRQLAALRFPCAGDDAYIALRYARNLADGLGPVFNPGERIWGYTSPLHVLVLGGAAGLGADLPIASLVLGVAANGLSAWLAYRLVARIVERRIALFIGLLALASHVTFQYLSLETPLVGALLWTFVTLACGSRPALTGLVGALACLARPDAMVLVIPVMLLTPGLRTARGLAAFALPGMAWVGFAASYYGDVLPHSLRVKFAGAPRGPYVEWILARFTRWGTEPFEGTAPFASSSLALHVGLMVVGAGATAWLVRAPRLRAVRPLLLGLTLYPWAMFVAYVVMAPAIGHDWEYWTALGFNLIGILLAAALGLERLREVGAARGWPRLPAAVAPIVAPIAVALAVAYGTRGKLSQLADSDTAFWDGGRYEVYAEGARWLSAHAPGATVFAGEPGILAYLTGAPTSDGFLISHAPTTPPDFLFLIGAVPTADSFGGRYHRVVAYPATHFYEMSLLARDDWRPR